jgi:hypothetical protein
MNKYNLYICAALAAMLSLSSCVSEDPVEPTADRAGITSMAAYFTSGDNEGKTAADWTIENSSEITDYVIPIPWYYPEDGDSTTERYMNAMKVVAKIENNCTIYPPITVLDLTKKTPFTYTDPYGNKKQITISGEMTKSDKCAIKSFMASPGDLSGIVDEDNKTISLVTAADLSECTAEVTLSPHATISPDPAIAHDYNDGFQFKVTADNGVNNQTYTVIKQVPAKIANGYRKGSETLLFENDMTTLGVSDANAIHPTLACIGTYVILDLGDGSAPQYFKKATGSKVGTINVGSSNANGSVTSDCAGNMIIANNAASGSTLKVYKTNSVTSAPTLLISYDNALGQAIGSRMHVQGNLNGNAIITATVENSTNCIRWIVTNGVVGSPENILFSGVNAWGAQDGSAKVVARTTNTADGCLFDYYNGGNCIMYSAAGWTNPTVQLTANSTGAGWGYNTGAIDARDFNNSKYLAIFEMGYWPDWGLPGHIYLYDASSISSLSGSTDGSSALQYKRTVGDDYSSIGYAGDGRCADVLMTPSEDGYFMYIFYASNTHLSFGGIQIDCIDK